MIKSKKKVHMEHLKKVYTLTDVPDSVPVIPRHSNDVSILVPTVLPEKEWEEEAVDLVTWSQELKAEDLE